MAYLCCHGYGIPVAPTEGEFALTDTTQNVIWGIVGTVCKWCVPEIYNVTLTICRKWLIKNAWLKYNVILNFHTSYKSPPYFDP